MRKLMIPIAALGLVAAYACEPLEVGPGPGDDFEVAVTFPQAVRGALLVNPAVYPAAELELAVDVDPDELEISLAGRTFAARQEGARWLVDLELSNIEDGTHPLTATAKPRGSAAMELVVSRTGQQITVFDDVGAAATPRLHRLEDRLLLTWADRREGDRRAFLVELDGAARPVGDRVALTPPDVEALYARVALSDDRACVLYQTEGGPYTNHLLITDLNGQPLFTVDLDPDGVFGSFGGAVAHDGSGCVAVFRTNNGAAEGQVHWARVDDETLSLAGPLLVAESGDRERDEGFDPFTFLSLVADETGAAVAFARKEYDLGLQLAAPVGRFLSLSHDGEILANVTTRQANVYNWFHDARVLDTGAGALPVFTQADLTDPDPNPPVRVVAGPVSPPADVGTEPRRLLIDAPGHRGELALAGDHLAWLDERTLLGEDGKIELRAAPVDAPDEELTFRHAVFIAGTSQLGGVEAGPGAALVWLDERHGQGLFDPKPEVWVDFIWR
jgi:hypothetical protein